MTNHQVKLHLQRLRQQIAQMQNKDAEVWKEMNTILEDLRRIYEQMQHQLAIAAEVEDEFLQQTQQLTDRFHRYYDLFQSAPVAYLVVDASGVILEANQAIAQLLNVPQRHLAGRSIAVYVAESDRPIFRYKLNQLAQNQSCQIWQVQLQPRSGHRFLSEWHLAIDPNAEGEIEALRIAVYSLKQSQAAPLSAPAAPSGNRVAANLPLPPALDGLRVLVVDDEADIREFLAAVLEAHGIGVRAVSSAAAALEAIAQFRPDVLVSDIRMSNGDGYSLIRQLRDLEAEQGGHLPAAAITAYLDEDREKALSAGFEAHLHKLAQPTELVRLVTQLAQSAS